MARSNTTQGEAIMTLLEDANSFKTSKTSYARVQRALSAFSLTPEEHNLILRYLEYLDGNNQPYFERKGK